MYQQWPWGGTAAASPTTGYVQPAASGQVAAPQWPAGFSQYAVTPEMQQQWAAWASQAQYAYGSSVPVGQVPTTTTYTGGYPEYQTASNDAKPPQLSDSNAQTSGQPKNSTEELVPQNVSESEKLKQLKEKAQQWKTLQQPVTASWSYSTAATGVTVNATTVTSSADSLKPHVLSTVNAPESASSQTQMDKEEEEFERQFKEWEKQFEAWKEQNINHPDKEAFAQYEKQWQEWRAQLLQKKEQMQKARSERLAAQTGHSDGITQVTSAGNSAGVNSVTGANVPDPAAIASNPNMYYPATQYMYMQPYMYPGNVPVPQSVPQQYPYGPPPTTSSGENYTNQTHALPPVESGVLVPPVSSENLNMDNKGMKNFDHSRERPKPGPDRKNNSREDEMFQNFEGYENSASYPSEPEFQENYQRDWKYPPPQALAPAPAAPPPMRGRGRGGRGRGRARGRGVPDRWSDASAPEIKPRPGSDINPRPVFPEGPGEFPDGAMPGPPAPPSQFEYPPENFREEFPPEDMPYPEDRPRRGFPPEDRFPFHDGPQPFPRDDFDKPFPPPPRPFDDRFHPEPERFPPPGPLLEDGFEREFDRYPPDDDMYGHPPPPFRDDFPPFEERFPPNRGRFPGRGRRFPRGAEFDRFGPPPFPPSMRDDGPFGPPNHPEFLPPPDDRFGFPGDMPPRMPPGRGMRPPFEPGFPSGRGRFPDERFFGDGPPPRFKSIDYTHRPASVVMGEDFDPHYEYESEFQDDVMQYRDNFSSGLNLAPCDPIIFSQVSVESFDYGHGMKPMTSTTVQAKKIYKDAEHPTPSKVFDYSHRRERSPLLRDRPVNQEKNGDRSSLSFRERERDRERDIFRSRDRERNRDRDRDNDKERERDRDRKDNIRDNRDRERDTRDREREKDRERDRDSKRDRDWERDRHKDIEEGDKRFKWDKNQESERSFSRDKSASESNLKKENDIKAVDSSGHFKPQPDIFKNETCSDTTLIEDLLMAPKRLSRPKQLVIILRGLPGSGKTYVAKLIKDREIENGGSAPRILSLDDYFMVEAEVTDTDPDTGKRVKRKEFKFEYELGMEEAYRSSLFKSFKKTIDDRFFPFIIVDAVHEKTKQYEQYWSYAKQRGFQVYIAEMDCKDPIICHKRNVHNRTLEDTIKILENWEPKPRHFMNIDVRSLLQDVAITEVEMEVETNDIKEEDEKDESLLDNENDSETSMLFHVPSRWEKLEATEEKLDQLDGLRVGKKKHSSMEDYLQLPDDYEERKCEPGKKRVRWADLEEKKEQDRLRAIGFVVGQTDWTKLTDPTHADRALTRTKYF